MGGEGREGKGIEGKGREGKGREGGGHTRSRATCSDEARGDADWEYCRVEQAIQRLSHLGNLLVLDSDRPPSLAPLDVCTDLRSSPALVKIHEMTAIANSLLVLSFEHTKGQGLRRLSGARERDAEDGLHDFG